MNSHESIFIEIKPICCLQHDVDARFFLTQSHLTKLCIQKFAFSTTKLSDLKCIIYCHFSNVACPIRFQEILLSKQDAFTYALHHISYNSHFKLRGISTINFFLRCSLIQFDLFHSIAMRHIFL